MKLLPLLAAAGIYLCACTNPSSSQKIPEPRHSSAPRRVSEIPLPPGFTRISATENSFAAWLRNVQLKKDKTVYLYNGARKANQDAQFAVLDISVGDKDLQQCADAVMRLRAEYLYAQKRYDEISFRDNAGKTHAFAGHAHDRAGFDKYLQEVFSWCGTASLEKQLHTVPMKDMQPGDVLIKGGSPGHAVMIMDVIRDAGGRKMYLIAQSYMPAQDIHILVNPADERLLPWYDADQAGYVIVTPEWNFNTGQLKRW